MLRQQEVIADDKPNRSLADFVAPIDSGVTDYVGAFAVTAGIGVDALVQEVRSRSTTTTPRSSSRRSPIAWPRRSRSTCTRRRARTGASANALSNDDLIDEKYRGIRPAFGYPACPDHSEKARLFDLLDARAHRHGPDRVVRDDAGGVGQRPLLLRIRSRSTSRSSASAPDQVEDYARRKGSASTETEQWLRPVLAYDPSPVAAR